MVAVMLMLSLAACDSGSGGGGSTSGKSNADLLKEAAANMKAAKSYHLNISGKSGDQDMKMGGDLDLGNNKSKLDVSAGGQNVTAISIGSDSYLSTDGGKTFTKSPQGIGSSLDSFTKLWDNFKPAEIDKAKDAIKDGSPKDEKVGSDDTRHMTGSTKDLSSLSTSGGSDTMDGTVDMWVTTGNKPTVRKMSVVGKDKDGKDINATIEWTQIDQALTIEAPPTTP